MTRKNISPRNPLKKKKKKLVIGILRIDIFYIKKRVKKNKENTPFYLPQYVETSCNRERWLLINKKISIIFVFLKLRQFHRTVLNVDHVQTLLPCRKAKWDSRSEDGDHVSWSYSVVSVRWWDVGSKTWWDPPLLLNLFYSISLGP